MPSSRSILPSTNDIWAGEGRRCWQVVYLEDESFDFAIPVWNFTGSQWLPAEKSDCDMLREHCEAHNKSYSLCEWNEKEYMCVCRFRK